MTGSEEAFAELDRTVCGKVRFTDGSVVDIRGRDTVVFAIDGGDHRAFIEVFFIPTLNSSVVSLGQLDESWFDIHIRRGVLTVSDHQQCILFKVNRSPNRLYKLMFKPVHPVCLAAGHVSEAWRWLVHGTPPFRWDAEDGAWRARPRPAAYRPRRRAVRGLPHRDAAASALPTKGTLPSAEASLQEAAATFFY
jgi:hypothetical protein